MKLKYLKTTSALYTWSKSGLKPPDLGIWSNWPFCPNRPKLDRSWARLSWGPTPLQVFGQFWKFPGLPWIWLILAKTWEVSGLARFQDPGIQDPEILDLLDLREFRIQGSQRSWILQDPGSSRAWRSTGSSGLEILKISWILQDLEILKGSRILEDLRSEDLQDPEDPGSPGLASQLASRSAS